MHFDDTHDILQFLIITLSVLLLLVGSRFNNRTMLPEKIIVTVKKRAGSKEHPFYTRSAIAPLRECAYKNR